MQRKRTHDPVDDPPDVDRPLVTVGGDIKIDAARFAKEELRDITIRVTPLDPDSKMQIRDYFVNSTLVAVFSPVLFKRLHGPMGEKGLLDLPRSARILTITGDDNHTYFDKFLEFMEGKPATFDGDDVPRMYMLAEFYEVRDLSNLCLEYWFGALEPSNCCTLMQIAKEVNCSELEERCYDLLVLGFDKVVALDSRFGTLDAASLHYVAGMNSLVVESEFALYLALLEWFGSGEGDPFEKEKDLAKILQECVRWDRVLGKDSEPPCTDQLYAIADPRQRCVAWATGLIARATNLAHKCQGVYKRVRFDAAENARRESLDTRKIVAFEATRRLQGVAIKCLEDACFPFRDRAAGIFVPLRRPLPFLLNTNPRQYKWGSLRAHNAPEPNAQTYPATGFHFHLSKNKSYMIGRRTISDIRVAIATASGSHFTISNEVVWGKGPEGWNDVNMKLLGAENFGLDCKVDREKSDARLVPYITGLSKSNGTFVSGERLSVNVATPIHWGAHIQLISPSVHGNPTPPSFCWTPAEWSLNNGYELEPWLEDVMHDYGPPVPAAPPAVV